MINVIDEKQMYDSVIMGKENVFKLVMEFELYHADVLTSFIV